MEQVTITRKPYRQMYYDSTQYQLQQTASSKIVNSNDPVVEQQVASTVPLLDVPQKRIRSDLASGYISNDIFLSLYMH